jgi:hypothetical protein
MRREGRRERETKKRREKVDAWRSLAADSVPSLGKDWMKSASNSKKKKMSSSALSQKSFSPRRSQKRNIQCLFFVIFPCKIVHKKRAASQSSSAQAGRVAELFKAAEPLSCT